jgi:hypothetical protein
MAFKARKEFFDEAQRPKAQALLETSAATPGGLVKAFDDYERSGL